MNDIAIETPLALGERTASRDNLEAMRKNFGWISPACNKLNSQRRHFGGQDTADERIPATKKSSQNPHLMASRQDSCESDGNASFFSEMIDMEEEPPAEIADTGSKIGFAESRDVRILRITVVIFSVATAILVSTLTNFLAETSHDQSIYNPSSKFATTIHDALEKKIELQLYAIDTFAAGMLSGAVRSAWPLVTEQDFEFRGQQLRSMINSLSLSYLPLIPTMNRSAWEVYSNDHIDWISESAANQGAASTEFFSREIFSPLIRDEKWEVSADLPSFLPFWQTSPMNFNASVYNVNMLSQPGLRTALLSVLNISKPVLGNVPHGGREDAWARAAFRLDEAEVAEANLCAIYYPILDQADSGVLGILVSVSDWATLFSGLLPVVTATTAFRCVLSNAFNQSVTYQINGDFAKLVGEGAVLDEDYESEGQQFSLNGLDSSKLNDEEMSGVVMLNSAFNVYNIVIYPSRESHTYYSAYPAVYTCIAVAMFAIMLALMLLFHLAVERRHMVVLKTAVNSTAIVSSLFPERVHDRLLETALQCRTASESQPASRAPQSLDEDDDISDSPHARLKVKEPSMKRIKNKMRDTTTESNAGCELPSEDTKPIADFFPNCTVMVSD